MRLIDADELKTAFPASENSTPVLIASVRATINHMPTIEHGAECTLLRMWMQPGDYCSYPKRREEKDGSIN